MKLRVRYPIHITKVVDIPEKYRFIFEKDETEYTQKEENIYEELINNDVFGDVYMALLRDYLNGCSCMYSDEIDFDVID